MKLYQNIMENIVERELEKLKRCLDVCNCERCISDIIACALNQLPPKYIVSNEGYLYSKIDMAYHQYEVDVIQAITRAAQIIKRNPRHNSSDVEYLISESFINKQE